MRDTESDVSYSHPGYGQGSKKASGARNGHTERYGPERDGGDGPRRKQEKEMGEISLRDVMVAFGGLLNLQWTQVLVFAATCTTVLVSVVLATGTKYTQVIDVCVYCGIYAFWVTACLPWLVVHMDGKLLMMIVGAVLRLFAADIGVMAWGYFRGYRDVLQRGLRLKPIFEPSMYWLSDAGYNLRYGIIVSALLATIISFVSTSLRSLIKQKLLSPRNPTLKLDQNPGANRSAPLPHVGQSKSNKTLSSPSRHVHPSPEVEVTAMTLPKSHRKEHRDLSVDASLTAELSRRKRKSDADSRTPCGRAQARGYRRRPRSESPGMNSADDRVQHRSRIEVDSGGSPIDVDSRADYVSSGMEGDRTPSPNKRRQPWWMQEKGGGRERGKRDERLRKMKQRNMSSDNMSRGRKRLGEDEEMERYAKMK